ncbi:response regulator transcription factor [Waterburya agarophytonicola K14]|uniref:Response regulator transcription factor n=1 Tax=Waterburya agarophytonicola KI4 TaxID=2874699 RepID=A0A964BWK9_9CYAN|nr:DNA-binding response regulator [Waterburya agarophytonicola]MCC0179647.1 response regulator transcription factor [Waterburya agarophytonicola KI4]
MLDNISPSKASLYRAKNILIIEPNKHQGRQLSQLIKVNRPRLKVMLLENSEQVFSLMYGQMNINILFFDIEGESNTDNLALIKAISPQTSLIHWSDYHHPEVIELLYSLGVNSFCTKESDAEVILEATDLATNYPQSLFLDRKLHQCLPLLQN